MADELLRINVEADVDDAKRDLDKLAKQVDKVEDAKPEVEVTADTGQADKALAGVEGDAKALDGRKVEIAVDLDADKVARAKNDLDDVGRSAAESANQVRSGVGPLRDFGGALGEAGGQAADKIEIFSGLGEAFEVFGGQLGLGEQALGRLSLGLAGIGLAVGGLSLLMDNLNAAQRRAAEQAQKLADVQKKLRDLDTAGAVEDLVNNYDNLFDAGERVGLSAATLARAIKGQGNELRGFVEQLYDVKFRYRVAGQAAEAFGTSTEAAGRDLLLIRDTLAAANPAWAANVANMDEAERRARELAPVFGEVAAANGEVARTNEEATQSVRDRIDAERDLRRDLKNAASALFQHQSDIRAAAKAIEDWKVAVHDAGRKITAEELPALEAAVDDVAQSALQVKGNTGDAITALQHLSSPNMSPELQAYINARIVELQRLEAQANATKITFERLSTVAKTGTAFMAGGPVQSGGFYDVGEAGRERVYLPRGAYVDDAWTTATRGAPTPAGRAVSVVYNVNVTVAPTAQPANVGREIVSAIQAYERSSGTAWRR